MYAGQVYFSEPSMNVCCSPSRMTGFWRTSSAVSPAGASPVM